MTEPIEKTKIEDIKPTQETAQAETVTTTGKTHRYLCPACTGVAYYSNGPVKEHLLGNCQNCSAPLTDVESGNFIELTPSEKQSLIDQGL